MVSTSDSIVGATMPAAPRMPMPRTTTPMTPTITVSARGDGVLARLVPFIPGAGAVGSCVDMGLNVGHPLPGARHSTWVRQPRVRNGSMVTSDWRDVIGQVGEHGGRCPAVESGAGEHGATRWD